MTTPFSEWLGVENPVFEDSSFTLSLPVQPQHCNRRGVIHGGVVSSLLDMALGGAVINSMNPREWCGTVSLSVQFIRPTRGEKITCRGRLTGRGRQIAFASGEIIDGEGRISATASGVWHIWPGHPDGLSPTTDPTK